MVSSFPFMQRIVDGFVAIGIVYDANIRRGVHTFAMLRTSQLIRTTSLGANRFVVYYHILSCVSLTTLNKHCEKE